MENLYGTAFLEAVQSNLELLNGGSYHGHAGGLLSFVLVEATYSSPVPIPFFKSNLNSTSGKLFTHIFISCFHLVFFLDLELINSCQLLF